MGLHLMSLVTGIQVWEILVFLTARLTPHTSTALCGLLQRARRQTIQTQCYQLGFVGHTPKISAPSLRHSLTFVVTRMAHPQTAQNTTQCRDA